MNYKIQIFIVTIATLLSAVYSQSSSTLDADEQQLSYIYDKMKDATAGVAMNLDGAFGAGKCNCVCKNNN